jgi:hypothetical protein
VFIFVKNIKMTNSETLSTPLNESQLYLLQLMSKMDERDLVEVKKLVRKYLADKLIKLADEAWERNGWTAEDEQRLLNTHMRTPYLSKENKSKA